VKESDKLEHGLHAADHDDLRRVFAAALALERAMYAKQETGPLLFRLRKSLEGIWGHELPLVDEWGNDSGVSKDMVPGRLSDEELR